MSKVKNFKPDVFSDQCPSREVLDNVTSRWGTLILVILLERTYRFSEIRKRIGGISEKMLAQTLQSLEVDGFVNRKSYPVVPPKVEYKLTPLGKDVALKVEALKLWVEDNLPKVMSARKSFEQA